MNCTAFSGAAAQLSAARPSTPLFGMIGHQSSLFPDTANFGCSIDRHFGFLGFLFVYVGIHFGHFDRHFGHSCVTNVHLGFLLG